MEHELNKIKPFIDKFTKVGHVLGTQQAVFDKAGLTYKNSYKRKTIENLHKKSFYENLTCFYCRKLGHKAYTCNLRRISNINKKKTI